MKWLQKFMAGRYGADPLNLALILLSLVLSIVVSFVRTNIAWLGAVLSLVALVPLILAFLRLFSRNRIKRAAENAKFMKFWNPIANWFQWLWLSVRYCNKNRYFRCPNCGRIACVPKKTGSVTITCKNCKTRYDRKA